MIPNKIMKFMGYNNLALVLEQERKHWLLKTDKQKQLQDKKTGDIFQGQIDNLGSDIIIKSEKMPIKNDIVQSINYMDTNVDKILNIDYSAFTYSSQVDGLMMARIISTSFPYQYGNETLYKHYKLRLKNCSEVYIPFGGSIASSDVFAIKWLKTTTPPCLVMMGNDGSYSIEHQIGFNSSVTNATFYYPLTETLQPLDISNVSGTIYETDTSVSDDGYIGYPIYWFTCDQSKTLTNITFENNNDDNNNPILYIGNEGNNSMYNSKLYFGISGLPDSTVTDPTAYSITIASKTTDAFKNKSSDFDVELSNAITISSGNKSYSISVSCDVAYKLNMIPNIGFTYVDANTYTISDLTSFIDNNPNISLNPLCGFLNMNIDNTVKPLNETTDIGFAGINLSSANIGSDRYTRYPYSLNEWDGLPDWFNDADVDSDSLIPQHMAIYAINNTDTYIPEIPDSRQVAALLFDPGKIKTTDEDEFSNDERGRIYVISNDTIDYENNLKATYPKPARTVARICDVPTSVMQLSNISNIAPTSIVDKKYVRSQASYTDDEKYKVENVHDCWVVPTMLDYAGNAITTYEKQDNNYVFNSLEYLNAVDFRLYNNLRTHENVNSYVDTSKVELASIYTRGAGYVVNDIGTVVVGGFAFHYMVSEIDSVGGVVDLVLSANEDSINLSNFDLEGNSGVTEPYGTSPVTGSGTGLRFKMIIREYDDIKPYYGGIYTDLKALVKTSNGLYLYSYNVPSSMEYKTGMWINESIISEFEQTTTELGVNNKIKARDALMNCIVPSVRKVPCTVPDVHSAPTTLTAMVTSSFINIIDKDHTPFNIPDPVTQEEIDLIDVDMCCLYCEGIKSASVSVNNKTPSGVLNVLKSIKNELRYDSFIFYKFNDPSDESNTVFTYGIIHRGFNNYLSTDASTTLPTNNLSNKVFVHSNEATTVVWDTALVGPMMWLYDPLGHKKEDYVLDPDSRDLRINRTDLTWATVKIKTPDDQNEISLVDKNNVLLYNIMTNNQNMLSNILSGKATSINSMYDFYAPTQLQAGNSIDSLPSYLQPLGNWRLCYPRLESFTLENVTTGRKFTPTKMRIIKGANIDSVTNIKDDNGNIVNTKCLVVNESSAGVTMSVYNAETGKWNNL